MKPSPARRSKKASPDDARTPRGERERALIAREEALARREHALELQKAALRARQAPTRTRAEVERLMGQMRQANERLIVAVVHAQNLSDERKRAGCAKRFALGRAARGMQLATASYGLFKEACNESRCLVSAARREELVMRMMAIVLLVAGVLGLVYGGFSFTRETHDAKVGPLEISISEKQRVNVPMWTGVVLVIVGGGLLLVKRREVK